MTNFLRKIGLVADLTIELPVEQAAFERALRLHVGKPQPDFLDIFSPNRIKYKGTVKEDSFKIKRRRKFFDAGLNFVVVSGRFTRNNDKLTVAMKLSSFHPSMIFWTAALLITYISFIVTAFLAEPGENRLSALFILAHAVFMVGIPYFILKRRLGNMCNEIEWDLHYMVKDHLTPARDTDKAS